MIESYSGSPAMIRKGRLVGDGSLPKTITEEAMSEYSPEQLQQALQNVRNELNQGHMQEIMKVRSFEVGVISCSPSRRSASICASPVPVPL